MQETGGRWAGRAEATLICLPVLAGGVFWAAFGRSYPDEPFLLYCGKLAWEGFVPYRDFLFTQMPLGAYVYGAAVTLLAPTILTGRAVSVVLTFIATWAVVLAARRTAGRVTAVVTSLLIATGSFQMFHLVLAKGYALAAACLAGGALLAGPAGSPRRSQAGMARLVAAGALLALAVLARTSALVPLLAVLLWLAAAGEGRAAVRAGAGAAGVLAAALLPFVLIDARGFWFGIWTYHSLSWLGNPDPLGDWAVRYAAGWATAAVCLAVAGLAGRGAGIREVFWRDPLVKLLSVVVIPLTGAHMVVGARRAEYHALLFPLACLLVALWVAGTWRIARGGFRRGILSAAVAGAVVYGLVFTLPEGTWLVIGFHPGVPSSVTSAVRQASGPDDPVLCLRPEVLLASDRRGLPGTEMGFFNVMFDQGPRPDRPRGSFDEEDLLAAVETRAAGVVVLREGDLVNLIEAAMRRNRPYDLKARLRAALEGGYELRLATGEREEGRRYHLWEVWVRRRP